MSATELYTHVQSERLLQILTGNTIPGPSTPSPARMTPPLPKTTCRRLHKETA